MTTKIDHIAIVVEDIDKALGVYHNALGLPLERVEDVPAEKVKVAFLPMPDGENDIELIQPTTEDSGVAKYLKKRGEGIHHICIAVDNIQEAIANAKTNGLHVIEETPRVGSNGQQYVFVHPKTTHGVLIEFYQKPSV